ncbi:MAG: translation elongation factor Ts [Isosphaeraceae bacterium]
MAEITAQVVNEFRKRTGLGLMECKALLKEADGDLKKAETLAKEKGLKNAEKRSGRAATAGRIEAVLSPDASKGALIELACETDFVARNDAFREAAAELAAQALEKGAEGIVEQESIKQPGKKIKEVLVDVNARTGENVELPRAASFGGAGKKVDYYIHHDNKSGALVEVEGAAEPALIKDLALHVVASKPVAVNRDEVPATVVEEQRRIFEVQVADKPEAVRGKIVDGKINAWYGESVLLEQLFVKDPAKKVKDILPAGITVTRFARFVVGESAEA